MFGGMEFCRFFCVIDGLEMMSTRNVSVMSGFFMRAWFMMLGRFKVVASGVLVVLGCFLVVFCTFVFSHIPALLSKVCLIFLSLPQSL